MRVARSSCSDLEETITLERTITSYRVRIKLPQIIHFQMNEMKVNTIFKEFEKNILLNFLGQTHWLNFLQELSMT